MEQRIFFGKNTPLSFLEKLQFSAECPYTIRYKDFLNDDVAPLHYADTLELGICCEITGHLVIGNQRVSLNGSCVYVIPPGSVHAITINQGPGHLYVMHISLEALRDVANVSLLLQQSQKSLTALPCLCSDFSEIHALVMEMMRLDDQPFARTRLLLELFELLCTHTGDEEQSLPKPRGVDSEELYNIIRWTECHFAEEIQLEQAAEIVGFTKNYFCAWFKLNTKSTYLQYLNQVRINNACRILLKTGSLESACTASGFRDMSYFIQKFKRIQGCTPKQYIQNLQNRS